MNQLNVAAEGQVRANPEAVWALAAEGLPDARSLWALVSDPEAYSTWGPWDESGYRDRGDEAAHGVGSIRWYRAGRTTSVEKILEVDDGRRFVYTVVKGVPVRNYRAEVTLTPTDDGTHIRWSASWDRTIAGRIVQRALRKFYPKMMNQLVAAADHGAN